MSFQNRFTRRRRIPALLLTFPFQDQGIGGFVPERPLQMSNLPDPAETRRLLEELARVNKDLDANARMQANAPNFVAAEQLRKRVRELDEARKQQMLAIVELHPDTARHQEYIKKSNAVDQCEADIKACKDAASVRQLGEDLDRVVGAYIHCFQSIVAELMGAPPPDKPIL